MATLTVVTEKAIHELDVPENFDLFSSVFERSGWFLAEGSAGALAVPLATVIAATVTSRSLKEVGNNVHVLTPA